MVGFIDSACVGVMTRSTFSCKAIKYHFSNLGDFIHHSSPSSIWRWHRVGRFVAILLELFVALACPCPCVACYVHEYRPRYSKTFKVSFRSRSTLYSLGRGLSERSALLILCSRSSTMTGASAMGASCDDDSDWTRSQ